MESLYAVDSTLFRFLNGTLANPAFDAAMPVVTEVRHFYPFYALLFILLLWKGGRRGRWCALVLALSVAIADPFSSRLLKEWIARERPCRALEEVHLLVACGGGKSFPSSHGVNNGAAATVISLFLPRWGGWAWGVALLVALSRIFVGVHYPSDVIGGLAVGAAIGGLLYFLWWWTLERRRQLS